MGRGGWRRGKTLIVFCLILDRVFGVVWGGGLSFPVGFYIVDMGGVLLLYRFFCHYSFICPFFWLYYFFCRFCLFLFLFLRCLWHLFRFRLQRFIHDRFYDIYGCYDYTKKSSVSPGNRLCCHCFWFFWLFVRGYTVKNGT